MKIYNNSFSLATSEDGRRTILIYPQSVSPKYRVMNLLVAKEIALNEKGQIENGSEISLGLVGKEKKSYMLFPPSKMDKRILYLFSYASPKHRHNGCIDERVSKYKEQNLLFHTSGSGAWGAGVAGMVILEDGDYIGNNSLSITKNEGGVLIQKRFNTLAEAQMWLGIISEDDIEMI